MSVSASVASSPVLLERHRSVGRMTLVALLLNIGCVTTAELLLRTGASAAGGGAAASVFGVAALRSPATVVGICFHVAAFGCWMYALRTVPLTLAYNFTAVNQGLVPIAAWLVLPNEHISVVRWMGIGLVLCGFVLLVPMLAKVEHEAEVVEGGRGMNRTLLVFGLLAEVALVVGQFLLKVAMHPRSGKVKASRAGRAGIFVMSIAAQALYFFLWLGLLEKFALSSVYPFDAAAPVLLVLAGVFLLRERLTMRAWVAISFIFAGLAIISFS